jgi:hypothetical protein
VTKRRSFWTASTQTRRRPPSWQATPFGLSTRSTTAVRLIVTLFGSAAALDGGASNPATSRLRPAVSTASLILRINTRPSPVRRSLQSRARNDIMTVARHSHAILPQKDLAGRQGHEVSRRLTGQLSGVSAIWATVNVEEQLSAAATAAEFRRRPAKPSPRDLPESAGGEDHLTGAVNGCCWAWISKYVSHGPED